jgi:hypothetical protein
MAAVPGIIADPPCASNGSEEETGPATNDQRISSLPKPSPVTVAHGLSKASASVALPDLGALLLRNAGEFAGFGFVG